MKKVILLWALFAIGLIAFSQEITIRFTGQLNGTDYCRLDRVAVINVTRNWTEMVEYPDTIIVLGGTVGANLNIAAIQGLGQNIPNPFDCETRVELSVSQSEDVRMQLLDVAGKVYAEYNGTLDAGMHVFDISAANPQTYLLNATVGNRQYSIRMVNVGSGCGCSIKYAGISGSITAKLTSANEFLIGDNMRYVGYITIDGESIASAIVEQMQVASEDITLNFTYYFLPIVTTGSATNITNSDAILSGNVNDDGGATVTERGFMYGTSASNLSQTIQSGNGTGTYTANITGLSSTITYYYKAYATNTVGTAYGEVISFTTIAPPSVQTNSASNITTTSATLSGNVTSDGSATVTARGFMYGTNASNLTQTIQSDSGTGSYTANLTGLSSSTTYYYKAYATNTAGTTYGEVMSFTTTAGTGTYNGHEWVDLGLPSGLLWATCNVGANTPSQHGNYYAWGEITTKGTYNWSTYRYCNGSENTLTKYCNNSNYGNNGFTDDLTTLETNDDAATVNWGWGWRMPTKEEIQELIDNCTVTWTNYNNSYGRLFVGPNGNSIFLPTSNYYVDNGISSYNLGYYWSSSLHSSYYYNYQSIILYINSTGYSVSSKDRAWGIPIRAVCPSGSVGVSAPFVITDTIASDVTTSSATISGNVTSDGGAAITDRGFLYGTNSDNLTQIVHSGSGTGSITANLTGLTPTTTYYYKAYATNNTGTTYGEVHQFSTNGTYNGYEWVDLGLPSGTLWATCNIGASSPTAYGNYYAWEETTPYTDSYTYSNNPTTLPSSADAATANWGSACRMPTKAEMEELTNNCTTAWTTQNGVNGRLFVGPNGNSIFLPAAGQPYSAGSVGLYWSSSLYTDSNFAWCLWFGSSSYPVTGGERTIGGSIRPICPAGSTGFSVPIVTTGTVSGITGSGATLSGNITYDCGATVTDRGFIYGTRSSNLSETIHCGNGMGSFSANITGLSNGTTYYYKAYATNSEGTAYGGLKSFSTPSLPTVITVKDNNITPSSATLYGYVSNEGGAEVTARGFIYGTNANNITRTVQSGSGTGSYNKVLTGLSANTTYYYKAYAINNADTAYGEIKMFTTLSTTGTTTGHDWVDLGLPSGIKWATCNVGSATPEANGNYYAWGETTTKSTYILYSWSTYSLCNGSSNRLTKYCNNSNYGNNSYVDNYTTLVARDDAATANWGYAWRMPTYDEMNELKTGCTKTWTTQNGINGWLFTGSNGNSIFLPAAGNRNGNNNPNGTGSYGYYWSSSLYTDNPSMARGLYFSTSSCSMNNFDRYKGNSVRPICQVSETNVSLPTVTTGTPCNITSTGATITGIVNSDGGATFCDHGFIYGTNADNLTQTVYCGNGVGSFTLNLIDLSSDSTYYYKSYVTNKAGTAYGEVMSFTTTENGYVYPPTVVTVSASETDSSAIIYGNVISDGNAIETTRGFMYGTSESDLTQSIDCGNGIGSYTASITGLNSRTTYYYVSYATNSAGTFYGEVKTFNTTINGHNWVDLGLPSGTLWATCNIGASEPTDYGNYYAWGETSTKTTYNSNTYTYSDNPTILPDSADAATANWGSGWRMPTYDEMNELKNRCTETWTTQNGINGRLFRGPNGNTIFLPAAGYHDVSSIRDETTYGYYRSSSSSNDNANYARLLRIYSSSVDIIDWARSFGMSVRPVCMPVGN